MKRQNRSLLIITSLIVIASIFPNFWQVAMTGVIGFFLAYLITKIKEYQ